ncbi:carbohydrate ABC transporter permease [Bifidobacterium commune]|uniref:carbohydrate ABC transporter permease n=1 Tax=Bifidobacterium commune TaxID=1505727 RepID=UPI000B2781FE|nr:sugar ABC transporter permease [Bifidobacterium commune]
MGEGHGAFAALLLSPMGVILTALVIVPIVFLVFTSFTNFNQTSLFTGTFSFSDFKQYAVVLSDIKFWKALVCTFPFTAALVITSILAGMGVVQLMVKVDAVVRYIVIFVLIFAWAMPNVASSTVWKWLFQPGYGVVNWLLTEMMIFGNVTNLSWSNNTTLAFTCVWLLVIWQAVPYIDITLHAATMQVDHSCMESAQIDGVGRFRTYWQIVVSLIRPVSWWSPCFRLSGVSMCSTRSGLFSQDGPNNTTPTIGIFTYKRNL